ncbi:MAG: TauD/TfdA family dioxygenase [Pseudomonadota bacterium]
MQQSSTAVGASRAVAGIEVKPLEGALFGAEMLGVKPLEMSSEVRELIWQTYKDRHGLICFSFDHWLEAEELHALTSVFGEPEYAPGRINGIGKATPVGEENLSEADQVARLRADGVDPYLAYIGNVDPKTLELKPISKKFYGEWEWHTDMSYIEVPPTFSLLHARIVPDEGGDTGFCSQVMAANELPAHLREKVSNLRIKHDSTYGSSGIARPGMTAPKSPIEAIGYPHPVIRRIPSTGDEALFLGRRTNGYVPGMELGDSEALLNELWAHATQERFCYHHKWQPGQVVAWDNRMMLHMRHPVDDDDIRFMWRTQTKGEAVVAAH